MQPGRECPHLGTTGETMMAGELRRDTLFVALTRPQMFAGVTYSFFIINAVIAVELFIIFRSLWVLLAAVAIHLAGMVASLREPRFVDLRSEERRVGKECRSRWSPYH